MKLRTLISASLTVAAILASGPVDRALAAPPEPPPPGEQHGPGRQEGKGALTPEEWKQYKAARDKAASDPTVVAAAQDRSATQRAFQSVTKKAMIEQDPSLASVLDKNDKPKDKAAPPPPAPPPLPGATAAQPPPPRVAPGEAGEKRIRGEGKPPALGPLKGLTPEDRQKIKAARQAIQAKPEVKQAEQKLETARKAYQETLNAVMRKADPAVGPLIEKMDNSMKEKAPGHGWEKGAHRKGRKGEPSGAPSASPAPSSTPAM